MGDRSVDAPSSSRMSSRGGGSGGARLSASRRSGSSSHHGHVAMSSGASAVSGITASTAEGPSTSTLRHSRSWMERLLEEGAAPRPVPRQVSSLALSGRGAGGSTSGGSTAGGGGGGSSIRTGSAATPPGLGPGVGVGASAAGDHLSRYDDYPLAKSLLRHQNKRITSLRKEGLQQVYSPKSNDGWIVTLFLVRGRALDWLGMPVLISVLHAAVYTVVQEVIFPVIPKVSQLEETSEIFFALVLNTTLSALLVYRLNRATDHFWQARTHWSDIMEKGRSFVGGVIVHGDHNRVERDHAIRWMAAFCISVMELLRGTCRFPVDHFAGLLGLEEIQKLADNAHPPIYAANQVRKHLRKIFEVIPDQTSVPVGKAHIRHLDSLEKQLNRMLDSCGGLQQIRSTPLPMVGVSHLRTLLFGCILLLPYIWGPSWKWTTIPIVAVAAYAWFGIEASAAEIECPFSQDRANALNMDGFCIGFLQTVTQQVVNHANQDLQERAIQWQQYRANAKASIGTTSPSFGGPPSKPSPHGDGGGMGGGMGPSGGGGGVGFGNASATSNGMGGGGDASSRGGHQPTHRSDASASDYDIGMDLSSSSGVAGSDPGARVFQQHMNQFHLFPPQPAANSSYLAPQQMLQQQQQQMPPPTFGSNSNNNTRPYQ